MPIKPIDLYSILSKEKYANLAAPRCALGDRRVGRYSILRLEHVVVVSDAQEGTLLSIGAHGRTSYFPPADAKKPTAAPPPGGAPKDVFIAVDEDGDGVKGANDAGDFAKLQQHLEQVQRFADDPTTLALRCVGQPAPKDEPSVSALLHKLPDPVFRRFAQSSNACPEGEAPIDGWEVSTPGSATPGIWAWYHTTQTSVKFDFRDRSVSFLLSPCHAGAMIHSGADIAGDGSIDWGTIATQHAYDQFIIALKDFVAHPEKAKTRQCGPCPQPPRPTP